MHKCLSSLIILQNLPQELEYIAGDVGLRNRKKSEMLLKCNDVYNYLCQVLNSEDMPDEIYKNWFQTVEDWILKTDKFLQHEGLLELVFTAANTKWFLQAKNIMSKAINKSSNAKIFLSASFSQAFQNISETEQRFLDSVAEFILTNQSKFEQEIGDPESDFCKELADLACDLCANFEVLLFQDIEKAQKLFNFVILVLSHSSKAISMRALEFFGELKETLVDIKDEVIKADNFDYILEPFFTASKIALEQSKRELYKINEAGNILDEDSDLEGQMGISTYREYSGDLFFNTYYLGGLLKGQLSKRIFEELLISFFAQNDQNLESYAQSFEVILFAARNTIDAVDLPDDKLIETVWTALLKNKDMKEPTMFHSALGFINEGSKYLIYNKQILTPSLEFIIEGFNLYYKIPFIQKSVFNWLVEIGQNASEIFGEESFEVFLTFIEQNASLIDKDNWAIAIEGIWGLCSVIDDAKIPQVMHRIVKSSTDIFPNLEFSDPNHRIVLIKSLLMLCGAIKVLSRFRGQVIRDTLTPILDEFLIKIGEALQFYQEDEEVYLTICNFYSKWIKALGPSFSKYFIKVATDWLNSFDSNKEHTKCIEVWYLAISLIGGTSDVNTSIESNFESSADRIQQKIEVNKDFGLIRWFSELCRITTNYESDSNKEIIFFLHDLLCNPNTDVRSSIGEYIEQVGIGFIVAISNISSFVSQTYCKCLSQVFKEYPEAMKGWIEKAFKNEKFDGINENIKQVFIKWLFGFKNHSRQFKLTIIEFQALMAGTCSEDVFIGRELKLNEILKSNDIIELD